MCDVLEDILEPESIWMLAAGGAGVSGGKMTAEDLRAAMRSAEDETDAAAAAAAELETAEELAEFTAEPVPAAENDDNDAAPKDE